MCVCVSYKDERDNGSVPRAYARGLTFDGAHEQGVRGHRREQRALAERERRKKRITSLRVETRGMEEEGMHARR